MTLRGTRLVVYSSANEADRVQDLRKKQKVCARKQNKIAAQPLVLEQRPQSASAALSGAFGTYGFPEKLQSASHRSERFFAVP